MGVTLSRGSAEPSRHLGTELPLEWHEEPSIPVAAAVTLFGAFFGGFSLVALHSIVTAGGPDSLIGIPVAGVLSLIGIVVFLAGLNGFYLETCIRIDASKVRFQGKGLIWGAEDWIEPLSAYPGVLATQRYHSGGENSSSYTTYEIHLKHFRDPERDIELYRSRSGTEHRAETERFATLLGVPVLTEDEDGGYSERAAADLDKSVAQRAEEGSLDVPEVDLGAIPASSRLKALRTPAGYVFEASLMPLLKVGVILLGAGLGLIYWYLGPGLPPGEGPEWVVPLVGAMAAVFGAFLVWLALFRVERLEVSPEGVRVGTVRAGAPLGDANSSFMRAGEIEEVELRKNKLRRFEVKIAGDRQTLSWGEHASTTERRLVRDAVLETLAE